MASFFFFFFFFLGGANTRRDSRESACVNSMEPQPRGVRLRAALPPAGLSSVRALPSAGAELLAASASHAQIGIWNGHACAVSVCLG